MAENFETETKPDEPELKTPEAGEQNASIDSGMMTGVRAGSSDGPDDENWQKDKERIGRQIVELQLEAQTKTDDGKEVSVEERGFAISENIDCRDATRTRTSSDQGKQINEDTEGNYLTEDFSKLSANESDKADEDVHFVNPGIPVNKIEDSNEPFDEPINNSEKLSESMALDDNIGMHIDSLHASNVLKSDGSTQDIEVAKGSTVILQEQPSGNMETVDNQSQKGQASLEDVQRTEPISTEGRDSEDVAFHKEIPTGTFKSTDIAHYSAWPESSQQDQLEVGTAVEGGLASVSRGDVIEESSLELVGEKLDESAIESDDKVSSQDLLHHPLGVEDTDRSGSGTMESGKEIQLNPDDSGLKIDAPGENNPKDTESDADNFEKVIMPDNAPKMINEKVLGKSNHMQIVNKNEQDTREVMHVGGENVPLSERKTLSENELENEVVVGNDAKLNECLPSSGEPTGTLLERSQMDGEETKVQDIAGELVKISKEIGDTFSVAPTGKGSSRSNSASTENKETSSGKSQESVIPGADKNELRVINQKSDVEENTGQYDYPVLAQSEGSPVIEKDGASEQFKCSPIVKSESLVENVGNTSRSSASEKRPDDEIHEPQNHSELLVAEQLDAQTWDGQAQAFKDMPQETGPPTSAVSKSSFSIEVEVAPKSAVEDTSTGNLESTDVVQRDSRDIIPLDESDSELSIPFDERRPPFQQTKKVLSTVSPTPPKRKIAIPTVFASAKYNNAKSITPTVSPKSSNKKTSVPVAFSSPIRLWDVTTSERFTISPGAKSTARYPIPTAVSKKTAYILDCSLHRPSNKKVDNSSGVVASSSPPSGPSKFEMDDQIRFTPPQVSQSFEASTPSDFTAPDMVHNEDLESTATSGTKDTQFEKGIYGTSHSADPHSAQNVVLSATETEIETLIVRPFDEPPTADELMFQKLKIARGSTTSNKASNALLPSERDSKEYSSTTELCQNISSSTSEAVKDAEDTAPAKDTENDVDVAFRRIGVDTETAHHQDRALCCIVM